MLRMANVGLGSSGGLGPGYAPGSITYEQGEDCGKPAPPLVAPASSG